MNLQTLEHIKRPIKGLIDVGAHIGVYSAAFRQITQCHNVFLIEPNPHCYYPLLQSHMPFFNYALGNTEDNLSFYMTNENLLCTGNSLYREASRHYTDDKVIIEKVRVRKLDNVIDENPSLSSYNILKLDTQGSELDILRGATKCLPQFDYIIVETSLVNYNVGAPLQGPIIDFMTDAGFKLLGVVEQHRYASGEVFQEDLIFEQIKSTSRI